ncbi:MAG TPA: DUF4260 domain-containing protein [Gaiellaceae bacterium]|nr:DUF4260 domain-containing protein [Gaiellaceae bacterium]
MLERLPRCLLRLEGLAVLVAALVLYFELGYGWALLAVLFLAPDLAMLGYVAGSEAGTLAYDVAHTYALPLALAALGALAGWEVAVQLALVWGAHIGMDRLLGYGLKYRTGFRDTHLQRV